MTSGLYFSPLSFLFVGKRQMNRRGHWAMTLHQAKSIVLAVNDHGSSSSSSIDYHFWCNVVLRYGRVVLLTANKSWLKELPDREKMKGTNLATKSAAKHFSENFFFLLALKKGGSEIVEDAKCCMWFCDVHQRGALTFSLSNLFPFILLLFPSFSLIPALSDYRIDCCRQTLTHSLHSPNPRSKSNRNLIKRKRCAQWAVVVVVVK